ncbi:hypothetical protein ABL78_6967 [Leptomonas seymouri]|uniref:Uncharacterized protein n=1 Tax=Leptomonas seymouri TaxID=5684 RepID=A0A0N1I064_LEPSE|nr:hypothetical protein ABL78_6967 [Leptomonas seymouri]|eukprot:KPI83992.1 hypothetical protein ABL78_6967 [Leptomonas seymouri]
MKLENASMTASKSACTRTRESHQFVVGLSTVFHENIWCHYWLFEPLEKVINDPDLPVDTFEDVREQLGDGRAAVNPAVHIAITASRAGELSVNLAAPDVTVHQDPQSTASWWSEYVATHCAAAYTVMFQLRATKRGAFRENCMAAITATAAAAGAQGCKRHYANPLSLHESTATAVSGEAFSGRASSAMNTGCGDQHMAAVIQLEFAMNRTPTVCYYHSLHYPPLRTALWSSSSCPLFCW